MPVLVAAIARGYALHARLIIHVVAIRHFKCDFISVSMSFQMEYTAYVVQFE